MSISNSFFTKIAARRNPMEIMYYAIRCEHNSTSRWGREMDLRLAEDRKEFENFRDQAHRLWDLYEQITGFRYVERKRRKTRKGQLSLDE